MVKIIVDSSSDLPEGLMNEYDIRLLPQRIYLMDTEYYDKVTINAEEVYEAMSKGVIPLTSMPRPVDILETYTNCCREGHDFIYVAISSKLSSTYQLAASLMKEVQVQYKDLRMEVIDSKSVSTAAGLIALQAAKLCRAGIAFNEIIGQITFLADHAEHIFMLSDLKWLIRGGRLSQAEGMLGSLLNIRPILHVKDGAVELLEKVRGRKKALAVIVDMVEDRIKEFQSQTIGISHAGDPELAYELRDMLVRRLGNEDIMINKIGATLVSHLGTGGVGVFFFNKEPELYI